MLYAAVSHADFVASPVVRVFAANEKMRLFSRARGSAREEKLLNYPIMLFVYDFPRLRDKRVFVARIQFRVNSFK